MMRWAVGLLVVANLGFFAWTQGWLDGVVGVRVHAEREPERLDRQVHPELIRPLAAGVDAGAAAPAASAALGATGDGASR